MSILDKIFDKVSLVSACVIAICLAFSALVFSSSYAIDVYKEKYENVIMIVKEGEQICAPNC